jgi:uncharacterized damage-inducible protein DinB
MQLDQIKELYDYNNWASERLWQAVTGLSVDQLNIDMHNGIGTIFTTLIHLVGATLTWRTRWEGSMPTHFLTVEDFSNLESIRIRWQEEERHMQRFLATLQDEDLSRESFAISAPRLLAMYSPYLSGNQCYI